MFGLGSRHVPDRSRLDLTRDGVAFLGRASVEAGVTRRFTLARAAVLDASGRLHRVEGKYEYSFRIVSVLSAFWTVR